MEADKKVEVNEGFKMVLPGSVYPKEIEKGEKVSGRVAEVALQLGKGVELGGGDDEPAQAVAEPDKAETASTAPETTAAASVPETKGSLFSEAETAVKAAKTGKSAKAESGAAK